MKRLLFLSVIFSFFTITPISAQAKIGSYYSQFFDSTYEINAFKQSKDKYEVHIDVASVGMDPPASLIIQCEHLDAFKQSLSDIRDKYIEWTNLAKENNITNLAKNIYIKLPHIRVTWYNTKWHFSYEQNLTPIFAVGDDGRYVVFFYKIVASKEDKDIKEEIFLVFSTPKEIDHLIYQLYIGNIKKAADEVSSTKELFN